MRPLPTKPSLTRATLGQLCVAPRTSRSRPVTTEPGRELWWHSWRCSTAPLTTAPPGRPHLLISERVCTRDSESGCVIAVMLIRPFDLSKWIVLVLKARLRILFYLFMDQNVALILMLFPMISALVCCCPTVLNLRRNRLSMFLCAIGFDLNILKCLCVQDLFYLYSPSQKFGYTYSFEGFTLFFTILYIVE